MAQDLTGSRQDVCSQASSVDDVRTLHIDLEWRVDFAARQLIGRATLRLAAVRDVTPATGIALDTKGLTIEGCWDAATGRAVPWELQAPPHPTFGARLMLRPGQIAAGSAPVSLTIAYRTDPAADGIQWLLPEQTVGKRHPYVMTQFQAIHARSGLPCQDSPAVKATYAAVVDAPAPLTVLMSALRRDDGAASPAASAMPLAGLRRFHFEQPVPVPSYLIALACGELAERAIGPRSSVWAEPSVVERAAYEFAETETFLTTAERVCGVPYAWGRYDVLVLPGSFPYGGMENACMTFVTPTLLAGDRSLADVVAHEIAHSWTGNLVSNATWAHFWLNEGFTVYVERMILQALHGAPARHFAYRLGHTALRKSVENFGLTHPFTALVHDLREQDPDDAFSSVPYERGSQFLLYLEHVCGGDAVFLPILHKWLRANVNGTVTSEQWRRFFEAEAAAAGVPAARLAAIEWDRWFFEPGLPPVDVYGTLMDASLEQASLLLVRRWCAAISAADAAAFTLSDIHGWRSSQLVHFLEQLAEPGTPFEAGHPLAGVLIAALDHAYAPAVSRSGNAEVRMRWYTLCIRTHYARAYDDVRGFLLEQGRMKFTRPLYRQLYASADPVARDLAIATFTQNRQCYHNICAKMVARDLKLEL